MHPSSDVPISSCPPNPIRSPTELNCEECMWPVFLCADVFINREYPQEGASQGVIMINCKLACGTNFN